jgi:hypothetical protein
MREDEWAWVLAASAVLLVLPVLLEWMRKRPPRSPQRLIGWAGVLSITVITVDAALTLNGVGVLWRVIVLAGGQFAASIPLGIGWARLRAARREDEERHLRPDHLALGEPTLWVRPRQVDGDLPRGIGGRVDKWLATDGPAPTAGWWHNGGLVLDEHGPALVDAAGLRHGLPPATTALVLISVPRSVMLVDDDKALLARLPTTGFDERDLRRFATAAGWRYDNGLSPTHTARQAIDLRASVVDKAARQRRRSTRSRGVLRRPHSDR